jgi:antitoxin HicB
MLKYPVELLEDDNETILVRAPDFPELVTFGENRKDALRHAGNALEEAIAARMADGEIIPEPTAGTEYVNLPLSTAEKIALYRQKA